MMKIIWDASWRKLTVSQTFHSLKSTFLNSYQSKHATQRQNFTKCSLHGVLKHQNNQIHPQKLQLPYMVETQLFLSHILSLPTVDFRSQKTRTKENFTIPKQPHWKPLIAHKFELIPCSEFLTPGSLSTTLWPEH